MKILSEQFKEIEENNKMGKIRDFFQKIWDTKEIFQEGMGTIKERCIKDLTKAEEINKRWEEYKENYTKRLNDLNKRNGVVTHLEPDILEYEVKCLLWSTLANKAAMMKLKQSYLKS